jgi:hypothetical protein
MYRISLPRKWKWKGKNKGEKREEVRREKRKGEIPFISRPREFSKSSSPWPHFRGDGGVVGLLGPEGGGDAEDARGFGGGEVGGEVVVVDSLPGFVGGAPVFEFVSMIS